MSIRAIRPTDARVRSGRIDVGQRLRVDTRTLGTTTIYALATHNISRTGLLLQVVRNHRVPYMVNTLLEMTVDPEGALFSTPVSCLGKIVRISSADDSKPQYGVQVVQLEGQDLDVWELGLFMLENPEPLALPAAS